MLFVYLILLMMDVAKKQKAIALRRKGKTYSEILTTIPVAKSTLSNWLCSVGLAVPQKQVITEKRRLAALRGSATRHQNMVRAVCLPDA